MIRIWPAGHGQELHAKPKLLVTAKAYLPATFGPNISDLGVVVCDLNDMVKNQCS